MSRLIVDETLRSKLNGLSDYIELCDESGHKLGYFLPPEMYRELLNAWVDSLFTPEELERAEQETGGRPLLEIWKSLGRK